VKESHKHLKHQKSVDPQDHSPFDVFIMSASCANSVWLLQLQSCAHSATLRAESNGGVRAASCLLASPYHSKRTAALSHGWSCEKLEINRLSVTNFIAFYIVAVLG
jgi:hypothetical protein